MFKQSNSSNRQKIDDCFFQQILRQHMRWFCLKDTPRENALSNKTELLTKNMIMYIWAIGVLNQLFIRDS